MVKSLSNDDQLEMRQKVLAYTLFKGNKPWDCARRYQADYLTLPSNPGREKFELGMQKLFSVYGEAELLFADYANKVNRKGKTQKRVIVVTEKSIYKQDPDNYKLKKYELALSQIEALSLSNQKDGFLFIHAKPPFRDLVIDLSINNGEKTSEMTVIIVEQVKKLLDHNLKVQFIGNIPYNNSRTEKNKGNDSTCIFQEVTDDPKFPVGTAKFKTGKNNQNIIMFK